MGQAITRAAGAVPRVVGEFQGYVDGADGIKPSVRWLDRKNMPQVGDKLYALPPRAAVPRSWSILLTSANHGVVGAAGSEFKAVPEGYERVQVMEIVEAGAAPAPGTDLGGLVRIALDGTAIPLAGPVAAQAGQVAVLEGWAVERVGDAIHIKRADGRWCGYMPEIGPAAALTFEFLAAMLAAAPAAPAQTKPLPTAEVPAPAAPKQCWSLNDEGFSHDSLSELLDNYPDLKAGAQVFTGMAVYPALSRLIDSDDVIDQMGDRAYDIAGEYADGYPDVSAEDKAELDALLEGWIKKACPPDFYEVRDVHTYVITEQDIAAQASTSGERQEGGV